MYFKIIVKFGAMERPLTQFCIAYFIHSYFQTKASTAMRLKSGTVVGGKFNRLKAPSTYIQVCSKMLGLVLPQ